MLAAKNPAAARVGTTHTIWPVKYATRYEGTRTMAAFNAAGFKLGEVMSQASKSEVDSIVRTALRPG